MATLFILYFSLMLTYARTQKFSDAVLVHEWSSLEYDWPSDKIRDEAITNGTYIPNKNMIAGIKIYNDQIYLTIPRWFWTSGHPVTLAKVVTVNGQVKVRPYPNWAAQEQGNCNCLQYVQGMEIDPNRGHLYAIDTGRVGGSLTLCRAKIMVYNLQTDSLIEKYELPEDVVSTTNFINDIVLDYVGGKVRFAYITDASDAALIVFDFQKRKAFSLKDKTMEVEKEKEAFLNINGITYNLSVAIDGIAMSPDFKYVYYCALTAFQLYQVPTASLRKGRLDGIRSLGKKISQSGGIGYGSKHLYYGAFGLNAVYYWDSQKDMANQKANMGNVMLATQTLLVRNDTTMQWPDTFGFDNRGWIWFVSNRVQEFWRLQGLPKDGPPYMRIWKIFVNESSYLYKADNRTQLTTVDDNNGVSCPWYSSSCRSIVPLVLSAVAVLLC